MRPTSFNLAFAIYDEERCESLEMTEPQANPFEDEQCVIASVDWLASHDKRARQAIAAGWDLLLVDEAHHLVWTPEFTSPGYALVESEGRIVTEVGDMAPGQDITITLSSGALDAKVVAARRGERYHET